jgi:hypothetical protein
MGCAMLKHNVRSIAREASAAPAAKFKSRYRLIEAAHHFSAKVLPAQPVDATLSSALIRRCFRARTLHLAALGENLARAAFPRV